MFRRVTITCIIALVSARVTADAPPPPLPPLHGGPAPMTCPVGGENFSSFSPGAWSTYGERPDGKQYSYLPLPFPVPECPTNKLVVFSQFTAAEIEALSKIIATEEYRHLAATETTYYRAYWLAGKIGRPEPEALSFLMPAIWQVTPGDMAPLPSRENLARAKRYQTLLVDRVSALPPSFSVKDRFWLTARAANTARELGRFKDASMLHRRAIELLASMPSTKALGWDVYLAKLAQVIARRDTSIEPLDMVPPQMVSSICKYRPPNDKFNKAICDKGGK